LPRLLVGGVGVANCRQEPIGFAAGRSSRLQGAERDGRDVFTIYATQVIALAAIGSVVIGLGAGAALPFAIRRTVLQKIFAAAGGAALHNRTSFALRSSMAFDRARVRVWPLGRVARRAVAALFRETVESSFPPAALAYLALMALVIALLIAVAIGLGLDKARSPRVRGLLDRGIRALRGIGRGPDGAGHAGCRARRSPCCGWRSQTFTGRAR